jgi:hypothetical protein
MTIEALVIVGGVTAAGYGAFRWLTSVTNLSPDPWGAEVEQIIQNPQASPLCHRCLTPQDCDGWFCPVCGTAVGQYNNYMPFVYVFSLGEVLRAGVTDHIKPSFLTICGYLLYSFIIYFIFAPIYWYFLFRNLKRHGPEVDPE